MMSMESGDVNQPPDPATVSGFSEDFSRVQDAACSQPKPPVGAFRVMSLGV